jgi:AAA15 family ATPase/GTPase
MLNHLHIQNYRLFRDLHIDKLGQVNLIAGKNNTGKTALLEALKLLASGGNYHQFNNQISLSIISRGDNDNSNRIFTIFNDNKLNIFINNLEITTKERQQINVQTKNENDTSFLINIDMGAKERINEGFTSVTIDSHSKINDLLWDEIALTPDEDDAVKVLQIIDSKIKKLSVNSGQAKVLIKGHTKPIPLKNLGDGANRLLTLALALVNSKNKMLLIDEFEVGLHHSVQEQLWEIIFKYAKEWNIQVFVTTHSKDTLRSFFYVAEKTPQYQEMANYFTLNRKNDGDVKAINYDLEDIETSILTNLEIR